MLQLLTLVVLIWPLFASADECLGIPTIKCHQSDIHESRISVPLDWFDRTDTRRIEFKYRILGYQHTKRPYLFVIGGGPASSSIPSYFNSESKLNSALAKKFRVVVFDQRGNGHSTPLDRTSAELTPATVIRYFGSNQIARDLGYLIEQFGIKSGEASVLAHSAGGLILAQYVAQPEYGPRPKSVILASSLLGTSTSQLVRERYKKQIELNKAIMTPELKEVILQLRAHIRQLNADEEVVLEYALDGLFELLNNPENLKQNLKNLLAYTKTPHFQPILNMALEQSRAFQQLLDRVGAPLSAHWMDGYTDLEWAERNNGLAGEEEDWMLLERRMIKSVIRSNYFKNKMGQSYELDSRLAGRRWTQLPSAEELRFGFSKIPALAVGGDKDPYVSMEQMKTEFTGIANQAHHWFERLKNGGHLAAFQPSVEEFIVQKLSELENVYLQSQGATSPCEQALRN